MIKTATAVKARIRNKSQGDSNKSQVLLRIYMMERLLERLSVSKYRDNFVLKGGLLVSSLVGVNMRSTMDIDTTVKAIDLNKDNAYKVLNEIISIDIEDGVKFKITKIQEIMEGHEYEGVRFIIECSLDRLKQSIKIDISTGDEITPKEISYELPLILEDRYLNLWAYNIETLLAEKLETIMVRSEANTRVRDYYDIHILLEHENNIDFNMLKNAFNATCKYRCSEDKIQNLKEIIDTVYDSKTMNTWWENYRKENNYVGELTWHNVVDSVSSLVEKIV